MTNTTLVLQGEKTSIIGNSDPGGAFPHVQSDCLSIAIAPDADGNRAGRALAFAATVVEWARQVADQEYHEIEGSNPDRRIDLALCPECRTLCRTDEYHFCAAQGCDATSEGLAVERC